MRKTVDRKGFYNEKEDVPDYKPNYEYVQKRIGSEVPILELMTGRKTFAKKSATANEDLYDFDYYTKEKTSTVFPK